MKCLGSSVLALGLATSCGGAAAPAQEAQPVAESQPEMAQTRSTPENAPSSVAPDPGCEYANPLDTDPGPWCGPEFPFEFGIYEQRHVAFMHCDEPDPCEAEVQDVLTLNAGADGALDVSIVVTQDNGHQCNFEGHLAAIDEDHWGWMDEEQGCRVELKHEDGLLTLTSDGCRDDYCGARARLMGTFALTGLQSSAQ